MKTERVWRRKTLAAAPQGCQMGRTSGALGWQGVAALREGGAGEQRLQAFWAGQAALIMEEQEDKLGSQAPWGSREPGSQHLECTDLGNGKYLP